MPLYIRLTIICSFFLPNLCFAQQDDFALAYNESKYGIISLSTGKIILPFEYDSLDVSPEGYIYAEKGTKWSLINSETGKRLTPFLYDSLDELGYYNLFVGKNKKGSVLIDKEGKEISDYYEEINNLYDEEALEFFSYDKCIKYDMVNHVMAGCDTVFRQSVRYDNGPRFQIMGNGKFNAVKNLVTGELVIPYNYSIYQEGDYFVVCDSLTKGQAWANYGIMDTLGNTVLSTKQTKFVRWLKKFGEKPSLFYIIRKDGKCGILNADTRQYTVPLKYSNIQIPGGDSFYGDFVFVKDSTGKYGLINAYTGETKQPHIYDIIYYNDYHIGIYTTVCNKKYGVLLDDGTLAVPCGYDFVTPICRYAYFIAGKDEKQGIYDRRGRLVLPVEYDQIESDVGYADESLSDTAIVRLKKGNSSILYNLITMKEEKSFTYNGVAYLPANRPVIIASRPGYSEYSLVSGQNGEEIIKAKNEIRILNDSLLYARTYLSDNRGYELIEIINYKTNEVLLSHIDKGIGHISGNYFFIFDGDKSTVFDIEKRVNVFPYIYDNIEIVTENTAIVRQMGKQGIINYKTGKVLTPVKYQYILPVSLFIPL